MEAPQQRRRRPAATYGKSLKKRYSDFSVGEVFSSATGSPKPREEPLEEKRITSPETTGTKTIRTSSATTLAVTTSKSPQAQKNQEKEIHIINAPSSENGGEANSLAKPTGKRAQTVLKGKKRPSPASATTSPPKHQKIFDFNLSDDDIVQHPTPTWHPKGNDEFDVPSSGEEESSFTSKKKVLPRRLNKAPSVSAGMRKFAKEVKPGKKDLSARDDKLVRKDPPSKKQERQERQKLTNKTDTTTSKVAKLSSSTKAPKTSEALGQVPGPSKATRAAPPESKLMPTGSSIQSSFTVEIADSIPKSSHGTRSKSRQPSVEPGVGEWRLGQIGRRTEPTQTKSHKTIAPKRTKRVVSVTLPVITDEPSRPHSPSVQMSLQVPRRNSISCSPDISPREEVVSDADKLGFGSRGLERVRGTVPRISEIFQNGVEESAPRRRRLIDRLGTGESQPDLELYSSHSSDEYSEEEYPQPQQPNSRSQGTFGSKVGDTPMDGQFQETVTEPLVKPVYNNGRIGPKITYARQRSFRTENLDENALFNTPLIMTKPQCNAGLEEDEELEGDAGFKMMKTIHELREAGVNNRFLDDIEELFGDIEGDAPLGRRRSGYLELASKIRDKAFIGKFRANNFNERLFMDLNKQTDEIICFSLSFILCCLLLEDTTVQTVSQIRSNGSLPMLVRMLDFEKDIYVIAKDRKTNMSKAAQGLVQDLRTKVEKSPAFAEKKPKVFSSQIMALKVLEESVRKLREAGVSDDFLPPGGLKKLVQIMKPFSKDVIKTSDILSLELTVSILESYTIGSRVSPELQFSETELNVVAEILPAVIGVKTKDMNDILLLILRFEINLTNNRSSICDYFAGSSSLVPTLVYMVHDKFNDLVGVGLEMEERLVQLDLLVLSLGLLINFAELSDKARHAIAGRDTTPLNVLLNIFLERLEQTAEADSVEESHTNVAFGYLSILLGHLCQNPGIREKIRLEMPKTTLTPLISSLEEFIAHHRKVDDQYEGYGEGPNAAFTERLEQVVKKLNE